MDSKNLEPWNPWQELEKVQRDVDRLFRAALEKLQSAIAGEEISFVPITDVVETEDEYRVYVSLPGVVEEDIDLGMEGDVLIIRGEREAPFDEKQVERERVIPHLRQWKYGYFERRIQMPMKLTSEALLASYDAGVLTIRIAKTL